MFFAYFTLVFCRNRAISDYSGIVSKCMCHVPMVHNFTLGLQLIEASIRGLYVVNLTRHLWPNVLRDATVITTVPAVATDSLVDRLMNIYHPCPIPTTPTTTVLYNP